MDLMPSDTTPNPLSIMTDFEKAAMNAFQCFFPAAETAGCYFHLAQSAWRKIQSLGLTVQYHQQPEFALRARRYLALAFVPPSEVHHYMAQILTDKVPRDDGLIDFIKYFQDTYVGQQVNDSVIIPGQFSYMCWNMYNSERRSTSDQQLTRGMA